MRILGFDSTGEKCSVGIIDGENLSVYLETHDKNTHSVNLMPLVDKAITMAGLTISDIDAFAVNIGPGSFTGIRIGVCTVKGLALASDKPCFAVNTLDSLAENAAGRVGTICAMIDARRTESYYAFYHSDGKVIKRISEYNADRLEAFLPNLPDGEAVLVGDGAVKYRDKVIEILGDRARFLPNEEMLPSASSTLMIAKEMAKAGKTLNAHDIMPFYLRASQAEQMKHKG